MAPTISADSPLITIVTVVYNDELSIEKTIQSVMSQNYKNIEYLIVDGGSTDGTVDIIKKYDHFISYWCSEPDKGIYDAMNKAIDLASGEWINFMNSGDYFINESVLTNIFKNSSELADITIIYGNHEVRYPSKKRMSYVGMVDNLWQGSQFCHQSAFINTKYHKLHKYNLCRKIAADYEMFYTAWINGKNYLKIPIFISSISAGGVSDINRIDAILEMWIIVNKTLKVNCFFVFLIIKEIMKTFIKIKSR